MKTHKTATPTLRAALENEIGAVLHEYRSRGYGTEIEPIETALTTTAISTFSWWLSKDMDEE